MREPSAPASASRRRLLAAVGMAPLAVRLSAIVSAPSVLSLAVPVDSMGCVNVTPTAIRFFDATGRLRVVVGCFDRSP